VIIIVPGLIHAGTTYLTRRLEAAGVDMGARQTQNAEESTAHGLIVEGLGTLSLLERENRMRDLIDHPQDIRTGLIAYRRIREDSGAPVWGFKSPSADLFIQQITEVFPDAVYLVCLRDHVGCAAKRMREVHGLGMDQAVINLAYRQAHLMRWVRTTKHALWYRGDGDMTDVCAATGLDVTAEGYNAG